MGQERSVGIATRYGLDGPGIDSRWGRDFSTPTKTGPGAHSAFCTTGTGVSRGVKRPGRGVDRLPTSITEVKGTVKLYLYFPSESSWPVIG
jgi:hypothetical protein